MIELNLTYEESKKILELGYDFGYICYEYQDRADSFPCIPDPNESPEGIPIIPKAALEACLPATLNLIDYLGNLDLSSFAKRFSCGVIDLYSIMQKGVTHEWFTTAYEAFIWCHENYPEELKKKFEEVMK